MLDMNTWELVSTRITVVFLRFCRRKEVGQYSNSSEAYVCYMFGVTVYICLKLSVSRGLKSNVAIQELFYLNPNSEVVPFFLSQMVKSNGNFMLTFYLFHTAVFCADGLCVIYSDDFGS